MSCTLGPGRCDHTVVSTIRMSCAFCFLRGTTSPPRGRIRRTNAAIVPWETARACGVGVMVTPNHSFYESGIRLFGNNVFWARK